MPTAAATAVLTSCRHIHAATKATVGSAVSNEPRAPPNADESRSRIRDSTVCAAPVGDLVTMSSLVATGWLDLIGRVEDRRYAVLEGHSAVRVQIGTGHDAADPATSEPDEVEGLTAVVELHHQCRDVEARSQRHTSDGATDPGLDAVRQPRDGGGTQATRVLLQITGLELHLGPSQARRDT